MFEKQQVEILDEKMVEMKKVLSQYHLENANEQTIKELQTYLHEDFVRFYTTFGMLPKKEEALKVFEIGANPYYLTVLMKLYTKYDITCANCFNDEDLSFFESKQRMVCTGGGNEIDIPFINFNAEKQWFDSGFLFDVICFCEVFEHFTESPVRALLNINKMLITGGTLIMSTPNVNRLENVARMISGANIYDPYSGYGRYGRHNREYNKHELNQLLSLAGFRIEEMFTKNVHEERAKNFYPVKKIMPLIKKIPNRDLDLGQYIFIRATKVEDKEKVQAPEWLYRSMKSPEITLGERTGK